ncbi:hypothetical protein M8C21_002221, partial [Ambrosia artemisiifolia]
MEGGYVNNNNNIGGCGFSSTVQFHSSGGGGGGGDSSEEELSVLPRHTKVVVTGNNRTKSVLVGLQGVVKKAVGLGGWHWLVLTNGIEVKLQRNALSVIEAPTGNEDDDDLEFENGLWNNGSDLVTGSSHNKTASRSLSCDSQPKSSFTTSRGSVKVDLSKLEMAALRRYWRHFNLAGAIPNPSKEQLVDIVQRHFMSQTLDELQVIVGFAQAAKKLKMDIANAIGLALAEKHLAARYNKPDAEIVDHYTYCILGDGCQMEGIANEACSLAGHWGLGKLIAFYDNHISIDGDSVTQRSPSLRMTVQADGICGLSKAERKAYAPPADNFRGCYKWLSHRTTGGGDGCKPCCLRVKKDRGPCTRNCFDRAEIARTRCFATGHPKRTGPWSGISEVLQNLFDLDQFPLLLELTHNFQ